VNEITDITERVLATDWTSKPGTLHPYQEIEVRVKTSTEDAETTRVKLSVGGVSSHWYVSTGEIEYLPVEEPDGNGGGDGDGDGDGDGGGNPDAHPLGGSTPAELAAHFDYTGLPQIKGTKGDETNLRGADEAEYISGLAGADRLTGMGGNDVLDGGFADDVLLGGAGDDLLAGGEGDDKLNGNEGDDIMYGGAGDDLIQADKGYNIVNGGAGSDKFYGGSAEGNLFLFDTDSLGATDKFYNYSVAGGDVLDFSQLAEGDATFMLKFGEGSRADTLQVVSEGQTYVLIKFVKGDIAGMSVESLIESGNFII
jgi:Ca2+-binding RTX toxin-like protein